MGRSFQITSTFDRMTTFQNARLAVLSKKGIRFNLFKKVDNMTDVTRETDDVLQRLNLTGEHDELAGNLSYGKHRALEIGMALATDPDLVMLDEPTAGMSKDETHNAVELVRRLTEGKTMVIIEHDMDVVFSLADRITVLHHGTILATGEPCDIRDNHGRSFLRHISGHPLAQRDRALFVYRLHVAQCRLLKKRSGLTIHKH